MMKKWMVLPLLAFVLSQVGGLAAEKGDLSVWAVDPLTKVFRDAPADASAGRVEIQGGANEYLSGQVAVRCERGAEGLTARWESLRHKERDYVIPAASLRWRFVGYIPVNRNTPNTAASQLIRTAPCEIPDPLLETREMTLPEDTTQAIWLTVFVPPDAPAGSYEGTFQVGNDEVSRTIDVILDVYPFILPNERHLWVTNWFNSGQIAKFHGVDRWSEEHWRLLGEYGRNMAAHRQNVIRTPISLVKAIREADGKLSFDFRVFDRWVELFKKAGACDRIEIGHVARFGKGGWGSREIILQSVPALDRDTGKEVILPPEQGLAALLRQLEKHLKERGWLEGSMIHVADEPSLHNIESWKKASRFVHEASPRLPRIDAIETRDFSGYLEVWVPKLNYLPGWLEDYRAAQAAGNEVWFYTCLHPHGYYPNRLLDYPLLGTRVLHWINWGYRLEGYLHWGLNFWTAEPFENPGDRLPPGDSFIIYPGKDGPLDSIRWEMMREGIQDYEEFHLLTEKTKGVIERLGKAAEKMSARQRSDEICRRIVRSVFDYEKSPAAFREARAMLLKEISRIEEPPLAIVATAPAAETELVPGPIAVEVYGAVEPAASVTVSGKPVEVTGDGRFLVRTAPRGDTHAIEIIVEHNGRKKTLQRHFRLRPL